MNDLTQALIVLIIGWLLGLVTPIIHDALNARRERREIKIGIRNELDELRQRLALGTAMIEISRKGLSKEILQFMRDKVSANIFPQSMNAFLPVLDHLLAIDDPSIQAAAQQLRATQPAGLSLRTYALPYTVTKFGDISDFPEEVQQKIFRVNTQLDLFNQHVEDGRYYRSVSFNASEGRTTAQEELERSRDLVANQGRIVIELIESALTALR